MRETHVGSNSVDWTGHTGGTWQVICREACRNTPLAHFPTLNLRLVIAALSPPSPVCCTIVVLSSTQFSVAPPRFDHFTYILLKPILLCRDKWSQDKKVLDPQFIPLLLSHMLFIHFRQICGFPVWQEAAEIEIKWLCIPVAVRTNKWRNRNAFLLVPLRTEPLNLRVCSIPKRVMIIRPVQGVKQVRETAESGKRISIIFFPPFWKTDKKRQGCFRAADRCGRKLWVSMAIT